MAFVVGRPTACHPCSEGDGHAGQGRSERCVKLADDVVTSPLQDLEMGVGSVLRLFNEPVFYIYLLAFYFIFVFIYQKQA